MHVCGHMCFQVAAKLSTGTFTRKGVSLGA